MGRDVMSRLVLATANTDFEQRVRDAFDGELHAARCGTGATTCSPTPPTRSASSAGAASRSSHSVPTSPPPSALALASAFDHDRPDISVLIVAPPSTDLLQSALRAGARDVIAPDMAPADLRAAIERAFDTATHRRRVFDGDEIGAGDDDRGRVIMALCPKGGAGKTTMSTNLALALAQVAPGEVVIVDLDLQFGDVASALGLRPDLTFADAVRSLEYARRHQPQGAPHRPPAGRPLRAVRARRHPPRPTTSPSSRSSRCSHCSRSRSGTS